MTTPDANRPTASPGQRPSQVKKASVASIGVTMLLVIGYLIASRLGIPLDGLNSHAPDVNSERPVAVAPDRPVADAPVGTAPATVETPAAGANSTDAIRIYLTLLGDVLAWSSETATRRELTVIFPTSAGSAIERLLGPDTRC